MRATRNTMPSHSSSHSRAPEVSHPPRIHKALNALWTVPKGTQLTRRLPSSAHNWGLPAHMELQGMKCPTGGRDGRPSPLALSGGLLDDDVLLLGPAVGAPVDLPLERTPIRSPSRFGGTLRPLAAGHSSQVWPLVSGSLLLLAIAIVLVLALAFADAGAIAFAPC